VAAAAATPLLLLATPAYAAPPGATWNMENPSVMTDSSGNGNDGTQLKNITSAPGFAGNGYHFVQGSLVTVPDSDTLDPGTADISITVHVRFDQVPPPKTVGDYDLIRKGLAGTAGGEWKVEIFPPSGSKTLAPAFCLFKDAAKKVASIRGSKNLADGRWHTITCSKTSSAVKLVVDGGATETKTLATALGSISNNQPVGLGQKPESGGGDQFIGDMDEVSVAIGSGGSDSGGGTDTTRPTVTATSPGSSAIDVSTATAVTATFSEDVQNVSTSTVKLRVSGQKTVVPAVVTYDSATTTATLQPKAALAANTRYTATLTAGIKDVAGNALRATSWSFTTGSSGGGTSTGSGPTLSSGTPKDGATGVGRWTNVVATFSEKVQNVGSGTFTLAPTAGGQAVTAAYSTNTAGTRWVLNPKAGLAPKTSYTVTLVGGPGGIADASGNPLTTTTWTFTTG
jgi:hypothetical protein